jgi:hypothetical protein
MPGTVEFGPTLGQHLWLYVKQHQSTVRDPTRHFGAEVTWAGSNLKRLRPLRQMQSIRQLSGWQNQVSQWAIQDEGRFVRVNAFP